jgi:hypothetical protein
MIASNTLRNIITIENSTIDALVVNVAFQREFPFLAGLVQPKKTSRCGRCRKKQRATLTEYRNFKNAVASMIPQDKIRFKQFMGCKQVRVVHVNPANKVVDRTF